MVTLPAATCRIRAGIGTKQQLLTGLTTGIKGSGNLGSAKGAVGKGAAVFSGKRNPLGRTVIDDSVGNLSEPIHIGLAGPEIAALDGIVKKAKNRVTVVLIILGCIDSPLGGDGVGATGAVLDAKGFDIIAEFSQRGRCRSSGQTGTDDNDLILAPVGRVDQCITEATVVPFFV